MKNMEVALQIERVKELLEEADAVMIGAGAGLSTAAGFVYAGERFHHTFADFEQKYGFHDMYSGGFYPYGTMEEYWAYWSRYIAVNRYQDPPVPVYEQLMELVQNKDYFVLTTNVDHCFQKAGIDKKRLFYTQGDYGLFQCSEPHGENAHKECQQMTFDNEKIIRDMVEQQQNMKIPSELIPTCPYCGRPLTTNLRADASFVQDKGWHQAAKRYTQFEKHHRYKKVLYLEIGVGYNTPGIIKYNFWQQTGQNPNASYVCLNMEQQEIPADIRNRSLCITGDSAKAVEMLLKR